MKRESAIVRAIMHTIRDLSRVIKIWGVKLHGGPMQRAGLPDILVVLNGRAVFVEVKRDKKQKPTPLQTQTMAEITTAGGIAIVVTSLEEFLGFVRDNA